MVSTVSYFTWFSLAWISCDVLITFNEGFFRLDVESSGFGKDHRLLVLCIECY